MYAKSSAMRARITSVKPFWYLSNGTFVRAEGGHELFSGMADVHFKFESNSQIVVKTTGFSRVRLPLIVRTKNGSSWTHKEKIVFMTSHDRTVVAAFSSRIVNESNALNEYEHNTPLVLAIDDACAQLSLEIRSGGRSYQYQIAATSDGMKFQIPAEIDVVSANYTPKFFEAEMPTKKLKRR